MWQMCWDLGQRHTHVAIDNPLRLCTGLVRLCYTGHGSMAALIPPTGGLESAHNLLRALSQAHACCRRVACPVAAGL